jgi:pre-mRNA-splicing factor ATP-dependent RNA helicase DHX15/PRP43
MADRRPEGQEMSRPKKARTGDLDPAKNPYLSHMYEVKEDEFATSLSTFKRHQTTALQAHAAEDGPNHPFNNEPLSQRYFDILKTRRDLPVHKQRWVSQISPSEI